MTAGGTAMVTGAARRIGRAIALGLGRAGMNIVIHDHRSLHGECERLCDDLEGLGVRSWVIAADFENPEEYESLIGRAAEASGRLDALVNNAAIFLPDTIREAQLDNVLRHLRINSWAPFILSREFARLAGRGKIVNVLDTRIAGYDFRHVSYILSKEVLHLLTRMTAVEFAPGISVNAVAPGLILPPEGKDMVYLEGLARTVPLQRHGSPEDVAAAVDFLLRSDFITGQVIYIDGGRHLMEYGNGPHTDH